ncbi:MAG: bifunctional 3,4-dihydroxy-2-butanone-4-phosphate synthase/GTP cyclohydrolase II [Candidatus Delongbacteria bacterium]|nr:bifunctional 3,4-dihydroxy-2-butanone-4-phosphate synthase/GTP cyclohydrolase II [Candidatus Delongbacteria bacterium]
MFDPIEDAIAAVSRGEIIIVCDDENRENEGDFIFAADQSTPEKVNFLSRHGRGIVCLSLTGERTEALDLPLMVSHNTALHETPFTVSIDALGVTSTGISAADRSATILKAIDPATRPQDLARPGHIFPLRAADGGVLRRAGHTEAALDLARLAGSKPAAVLCEILNDDGTMARVPQLYQLKQNFGLKLVTIRDLIEYRQRNEKLVEKTVELRLPTRLGAFRLVHFSNSLDNLDHVALVKGDLTGPEPVLVRVHSECMTGDVFHSLRCDCGQQLDTALELIEKEGRGVVLYMRQEGRGIGLKNKLLAYNLQDKGADTVEANEKLGFAADLRDYGLGAQMLKELGISRMRLLTNNPRKIVGLSGFGLEVVERIPLVMEQTEHNFRYLETKRTRLGHLFNPLAHTAPPEEQTLETSSS